MSDPRKTPRRNTGPRTSGAGKDSTAGKETAGVTMPQEDVKRLLELRHHDPHRVLGAHPTGEGVRVRVYRPDAAEVTLAPEGLKPRPMTRVHPAGLFECLVPRRREVFAYRLHAVSPDGHEWSFHDPYRFWPTVGELDLHLFGEGNHEHIYNVLGAHVRENEGVRGVSFAVWAPNAEGVSVVGAFNSWDGRIHPMRVLGGSGVWELFVPGLEPGERYKYEIHSRTGRYFLKADPYANATETPPQTASVVTERRHTFEDDEWMQHRREGDFLRQPMSIYEVHMGSWRSVEADGSWRPMTYRELAPALADYASRMGFTHVEFMPFTEHPFTGSWGYQVTSYFAPTARYGSPDDLRHLVDQLHQQGVGVILDWVPAHFPKDAFALGRFDGTALYEHEDWRLGEHPDWGTYIFNYGRPEVRNFLLGSALYWLEEFHVDGLRLDAVASMIYLDYSREAGQWLPNRYGGNENLDAIEFLKALNIRTHAHYPGALIVAEESTAWGGVSRPVYAGGLGFGFKWNMGWMHDTLQYFSRDPVHRRYHHNNLTFGLLYAWTENFILPLSHDEVVHGKRALLDKMPGDRWQKFANLRALYAYMWAHPGKQLLFMGGEFGQWREWSHNHGLDWHLVAEPDHAGLQALVRDLNHLYRDEPALWDDDHEPQGFQWIDASDADGNILSFIRRSRDGTRQVVCVCNFSPVPRYGYRVGLPRPGRYTEILNTDAAVYGGSNVGNAGGLMAEPGGWHGQPYSAPLTLPPLGVVWFRVP